MKRNLEVAIISDVHLGTYGCHAEELLTYLESIHPDTLVINGDFIDMWQFKKRHFPSTHLRVIQRILKMSMNGTRVYYITGNHDDPLRKITDLSAGNIHLRDKLVLQLRGEKYWIFHGDLFDASIHVTPILARLGGKGYDLLIRLNRWINKWRIKFGKEKMSFAKKIKYSVKEAVKFISNFEKTAIQLAVKQGYKYVVCGHIHRAEIKEILTHGEKVIYMNSGDWVESLTSLEFNKGKWTIFEYEKSGLTFEGKESPVKEDATPEKKVMADLMQVFNRKELKNSHSTQLLKLNTILKASI